jgi:hypothetical protein
VKNLKARSYGNFRLRKRFRASPWLSATRSSTCTRFSFARVDFAISA